MLPYKCHLCDYKCTAKGRLNRHLKGHLKKTSFKCCLCNFKCAREVNLNKHIAKNHSEQSNNKTETCFKDNFVGLEEESCRSKKNTEDDDEDVFQFNSQKGFEDVGIEVIIKEERLWEV